jgi:hypothetical protein
MLALSHTVTRRWPSRGAPRRRRASSKLKARHAFHALARDHQRVGGQFAAQVDAGAAAGIQALGVLAHDHVVDLAGVQPDSGDFTPRTAGSAARWRTGRAGSAAQVQVVADLGAVRVGDPGRPAAPCRMACARGRRQRCRPAAPRRSLA